MTRFFRRLDIELSSSQSSKQTHTNNNFNVVILIIVLRVRASVQIFAQNRHMVYLREYEKLYLHFVHTIGLQRL